MTSFVECIRDVEREVRELKSVLRARWELPMADAQRRHQLLRKRATELYVAVAFSRGRLHVVRRPRGLAEGSEWNAHEFAARVAERLTSELVRDERATPSVAATEVTS
jgi:hypothetical protein